MWTVEEASFYHFFFFFSVTEITQQIFQGPLVVTVYFPYKGHNKINAVHTDRLWDMVNR